MRTVTAHRIPVALKYYLSYFVLYSGLYCSVFNTKHIIVYLAVFCVVYFGACCVVYFEGWGPKITWDWRDEAIGRDPASAFNYDSASSTSP